MAETPEKQPVIPPAPEIDVIKPIEPAEPSKEKKPVMSEAELAREKSKRKGIPNFQIVAVAPKNSAKSGP